MKRDHEKSKDHLSNRNTGLFGGGGLGFVVGLALYYWATIEAKSMEHWQVASYLCAAGKAPFALTMSGAVAGPVIGLVVGGAIAIMRYK